MKCFIFQIHGPDAGTSFAEVIRTMDDLVRSGKVRYVGACNLTGWQLQKFVEVGRQLGTNPWVTLQVRYHGNLYNIKGQKSGHTQV